MRVLVTAASRHGTTAEIAATIADVLREAHLEVDVVEPDAVGSINDYDAVVVGSAVYAGHWLKPAKAFIEQHELALRGRPVFLFSSGPLGDPPRPIEDPADVADIDETTMAIDHRVFAGRLVEDELGRGERLIVRMVSAPFGDFRSWDEITEWAREIARFIKADEDAMVGVVD
jgi:menaquinone-dependent protoporphyrinogen oxidase